MNGFLLNFQNSIATLQITKNNRSDFGEEPEKILKFQIIWIKKKYYYT